jgi:hypothetical protein
MFYFIFVLGQNILGRTELIAGLCIQKFEKEYSTKNSHAGNIIRTSVWRGHIGSRWYTSDPKIINIDMGAFITPWYQFLEDDVEEHGFEHLKLGGYSLIHVGVLCKSLASQVFLSPPPQKKKK